MVGVLGETDNTERQLSALTEDITGIDFGDKDIEGMPLVNGGRVVKKKPQEDESISLKVYPIGVANDGTGVDQFFSGTAIPTADPYTIFNDSRRRRHRLVLVFRDDLPTAFATGSAQSAITAGTSAFRIVVANAYCTSVKHNFDDKILSSDVTFKWAPYDKNGQPNRKMESTGTAGLSAVSATATSL